MPEESKPEVGDFSWTKTSDTYEELDKLMVKLHDDKKLNYAEMLVAVKLEELHVIETLIRAIVKDMADEKIIQKIEEVLNKMFTGIQKDATEREKHLAMIK